MLKTFDTIVYMEGYKIREILECTGYENGQYKYVNIYRYNPEEDLANAVEESAGVFAEEEEKPLPYEEGEVKPEDDLSGWDFSGENQDSES